MLCTYQSIVSIRPARALCVGEYPSNRLALSMSAKEWRTSPTRKSAYTAGATDNSGLRDVNVAAIMPCSALSVVASPHATL